METNFTHLLLGKDLRTIRRNNGVIDAVHDQASFDELFALVFHRERTLVMRAVDAVEKITASNKEYLIPHKAQLFAILKSADHKELKWHIAQLITRIDLDNSEAEEVSHILGYWAMNKNESKIVRVNSLQGLFDLSKKFPAIRDAFENAIHAMETEPIPSIQARIRKLRKAGSA